jgi:hypothetical protein
MDKRRNPKEFKEEDDTGVPEGEQGHDLIRGDPARSPVVRSPKFGQGTPRLCHNKKTGKGREVEPFEKAVTAQNPRAREEERRHGLNRDDLLAVEMMGVTGFGQIAVPLFGRYDRIELLSADDGSVKKR